MVLGETAAAGMAVWRSAAGAGRRRRRRWPSGDRQRVLGDSGGGRVKAGIGSGPVVVGERQED